MEKIINVGKPFVDAHSASGTNYVKGDYNTGTKLYPIKTTKGVFNLSRDEVISQLLSVGIDVAVNLTFAAFTKVIGSCIDTSKISDK